LIRLDKIASATRNFGLPSVVELSEVVPAAEGVAVAVRALEQKQTYGDIELVSGRQAKVLRGEVIAGVVGSRRALKGFVGEVPRSIRLGDRLHLLNRGGVVGLWLGGHSEHGAPLAVEVMGAVLRERRPLLLRDFACPWLDVLPPGPPMTVISGTCMEAGKTTAAAALIGWLSRRGLRVAAAKLTGIACQRDLLLMRDHGAVEALSFLDAGLPSTASRVHPLARMAKGLIAALGRCGPDVIVVEMGDGLLGDYGAEGILRDRQIQSRIAFHLVCAGDVAGAYGAWLFCRSMGLTVDGFSGPVSDNAAGSERVLELTGLASYNVLRDLGSLGQAVAKALGARVHA